MVGSHVSQFESADLFLNHISNREDLAFQTEEAPEILVPDLGALPNIESSHSEQKDRKAAEENLQIHEKVAAQR